MTSPATPSGFILTALTLSGPSVPASEIRFSRGLNVVSGPSDTGKTFIAQCIDFMLGASTLPKRIPEADGYDTARLEIQTADGAIIGLERSLSGGAFRVQRDGETVTLGERHQGESENTLSHLLLSLTGFTGKRVRTNAYGATRSLSFRDIAHLLVVDEEAVITERSPILTGQNISRTAEASVFRLFLTGVDDSALVEQEKPSIVRVKQQGKRELLEELLAKNRHDISDAGLNELSSERVHGALHEARDTVETLMSLLSDEQASASTLEDERRSTWQSLRQSESRAAVAAELQRRFELLQEQYASDLRRLEAIGEAGVRLAQMTEERCPVCGAIADHQDQEHRTTHATPQDVVIACNAEAQKIQLLERELTVTISVNDEQIRSLNQQSRSLQMQMESVQGRLRNEMQPRIAELVKQVRSAEERRAKLSRLADLYRRDTELAQMLAQVDLPIPRQGNLPSASVGSDEAERFCQAVEALLRAWNFPNLDRVTFSEDDQDLVISGRKRSSHGKGVRALTHAAFSLALLHYCRQESRPHPGLIVIDSPLVVYREPESSEGAEVYDVKDAFYRGVASTFGAEQIIVLENEDPPGDLDGANIIAFTGAEHGRSGFLPRHPTASP